MFFMNFFLPENAFTEVAWLTDNCLEMPKRKAPQTWQL